MSTRIKCPSEDWDRYIEAEERAVTPTDDDLLRHLDAYGHLTWTVGWNSEGDSEDVPDRGDWMACFDYLVYDCPDRGRLVAYHTVVNSDSGGFIDTLEAYVVPAAKAPFNLPDYWTGIGMEHNAMWTDDECNEANKCNDEWNRSLQDSLAKPEGYFDGLQE